MPAQFTEICVFQNEFLSGNLATTTQSCYNPLDVYSSLAIEFVVILSIIFIFIYLFRKK